MPILPNEVRGKIQQRRIERINIPDRLGEEGILHLVNFNEERYFAKEWYTISEKRLHMSIESGGSPASPYWHKVKTYESHLIHAVVPELTLRVAASYDPRITKDNGGEYQFAYQTGRPVHVTPEVKADPVLQEQRDAVIVPTYAHMLGYHDETHHGWYATPDERANFYRVIAEADEQLEALFGQEALTIPLVAQQPISEPLTIHTAKAIADQTRLDDNGSGPAQMWKYGIVPIHTHFNFIPENKDAAGKVHGKYIEVAIFDLNRYWQELSKNQDTDAAKQMIPKIERYRMYRMLDDLFDRIIWGDLDNSAVMHDEAVQTAVFQMLETVRNLCEQYSNAALDQLYNPILAEIGRVVQQTTNSAIVASDIQHLKARIMALPVQHQ